METKEITKAIIAVMKEVNNIKKGTTVGSGNNAYQAVSDKDVKQAIRVSMIENGLSIAPVDVQGTKQIDRWEVEETWNGKTQIKTKQSVFTDVTTKYELSHISGETKIIAGYGQGVDTQDKGAGKATTYALKNALINLFLIPTGDDTDNTHSDDIATPQKQYNNDERGLLQVINDMKSSTTKEDRVKFKEEGKGFAKSDKQIKWLTDEWSKLS